MAKIILIFGVIGAFSLTGIDSVSLDIRDCGSKIGKFSTLSISDCDMTKAACVLHRNTNATIEVKFSLVGVDKVDKVKTVVHGVILGIPIEFPLPNPDACKDSGLICPLEKGKDFEYITTLPVYSTYPKLKVLVRWELRDEHDVDILCVEVPAKIE